MDSAGYAGRIYDRLTAHFGEDAVFMDVDTIEAGVDFVEVLQNAVQACDVLVALIGRRWLSTQDATRITSYNVCYTKLLRVPVV